MHFVLKSLKIIHTQSQETLPAAGIDFAEYYSNSKSRDFAELIKLKLIMNLLDFSFWCKLAPK